MAEFLDLGIEITDEFIDNVVQQCSFSKMKSNPMIRSQVCRKDSYQSYL